MRFYYISIFSVMLLGLIYLFGTGLLVWFGLWLRKRRKWAWGVMLPLFLLLYAAPVAEEFWIAWRFGQLCKKDAGIFVYKTVEVEGYYDTTRSTKPVPLSDQGARDLDRGGYRFYEMLYPDMRGESNKVVHLEKVNGVWTPTVLDHPTARYLYRRLAWHTTVGHEVKRFENAVLDTESNEVLGRYVNYYRGAPWFFIGLDRPTIPCTETESDTRKNGTISVDALVFGHGPKGNSGGDKK